MRHARDLTSEQRHALERRLQPTTGYLYRLANRMQRLGWDEADPVYVAARRAHAAMVDLHMALTYSAPMGLADDAGPATGLSVPPGAGASVSGGT